MKTTTTELRQRLRELLEEVEKTQEALEIRAPKGKTFYLLSEDAYRRRSERNESVTEFLSIT